MFRYIGFFWNDGDAAACATARYLIAKCHTGSAAGQGLAAPHGSAARQASPAGQASSSRKWSSFFDPEGFALLVAGAADSSQVVKCGGGVILGRLFRAARAPANGEPAACGRPCEPSRNEQPGDHSRCERLSEAEVTAILRTRGRHLIANYWGNYVALLRDRETRTRWVLRGPASTLPCLHTAIGGVDVYFSWTEALARFDAASFSINWPQLARTLVGPLVSPQTGLNEVHEILPGFCDEVRGAHRVQHRYWDPIEIARTNAIEDFDTAAHTLNAVTRACVAAWAQATPRILHALSGGLDSSIVLGCLRDAPARPDITCLTHFAEGPDSDEREFARLAAREAGCRRHIERRHVADMDLRSVLHGVRLETTPGMRIPALDRIEPDVALEAGAGAVYKGHGGDELYCRHSRYIVSDFLRAHGVRAELLKLILHSAVIEGETVWSIVAGALRDTFIPRRWNLTEIFCRDQENQSLLHPQVLRATLEDRSFDFPAVRSTRECSPGRLWQISLITGRRLHYFPSMRDGDPENVSPLLSQPIIEVCLRIPTWLQMKDRRERAVARAAFTREVPRAILERRWKGGAEQIAWKMLCRNLPFIRELLLDGVLARERIIDRPRLEALLSASPASVVKATVPVFDLLGAEAWLQAWAGRGVRSAP